MREDVAKLVSCQALLEATRQCDDAAIEELKRRGGVDYIRRTAWQEANLEELVEGLLRYDEVAIEEIKHRGVADYIRRTILNTPDFERPIA
jgi:hypothetical protein